MRGRGGVNASGRAGGVERGDGSAVAWSRTGNLAGDGGRGRRGAVDIGSLTPETFSIVVVVVVDWWWWLIGGGGGGGDADRMEAFVAEGPRVNEDTQAPSAPATPAT